MSLQNLFRIQSEYSASNDTDIRRQNYGFCPRRRYHYDVIRIVTFIPETPKLQCICFLATLETPHDSIFGETSAKRAIFRMHRAYQPLTPANNIYLRQRWDQEFYEEHRKKISLGGYIWIYSKSSNVVRLFFLNWINSFLLVLPLSFTHNLYFQADHCISEIKKTESLLIFFFYSQVSDR